MTKRLLLPAFILIFVVPILINILVQTPAIPFVRIFGSGEDWFGFFASYFGGAVGALVAVYIAYKQVDAAKNEFQERLVVEKQQRLIEEEKNHNQIKQENRMFINFEWKWTEWDLEKSNEL